MKSMFENVSSGDVIVSTDSTQSDTQCLGLQNGAYHMCHWKFANLFCLVIHVFFNIAGDSQYIHVTRIQ